MSPFFSVIHPCPTPTKNANISGTFNIFGSPKASQELPDPLLNSDCSNSSWAELSSYIVGTYQMFPMTRETQQIFVLRYLRPIGEYQEVKSWCLFMYSFLEGDISLILLLCVYFFIHR